MFSLVQNLRKDIKVEGGLFGKRKGCSGMEEGDKRG
jgi:hypothetical protein